MPKKEDGPYSRGVKSGRRGYVGVKLARVRRCEPRFEFGGKKNVEEHWNPHEPLIPWRLPQLR